MAFYTSNDPLAFLREQGVAGREGAARTLMKLGLTYHLAFDFPQARRAYDEGLALWQWTSPEGSILPPAPHPLRFLAGEPLALDPALARDSSSVRVVDQLFSGLLALSPELDVVPEIARNWKVLEGGCNYLFYLRDDVRWSDGQPVTAEDFVFAWQRVLHPATASPVANLLYDVKGGRAFHYGELADPAELGVRALDPTTLLVELEMPTGHFPHLLTNSATYPVPRQALEKYGQAWAGDERIVTNGPFRLERWERGQELTLARNPAYFGQTRGNIQQVALRFSTDPTLGLAEYEADRLDVLYLGNLPPLLTDSARQRYAGEYLFGPSLDTLYLSFHLNRPPFNRVEARQALALAIDQERLASVALGGYVAPGLGGFVPPGIPGHSPDIGLPYDPEQARWLLAEAGYPQGRNFPEIEWRFKPGHDAMAHYLQTQWQEQLGLKLTCQSLEWAKLLHRLDTNPPDLFLMGWQADYLDPDNFLRVGLYHRGATWSDEAYVTLVEQARQLTDQHERLKLHRQADKMLIDQAVLVPLTYSRNHFLVKSWVRQFPISALKTWYWKDVIIE